MTDNISAIKKSKGSRIKTSEVSKQGEPCKLNKRPTWQVKSTRGVTNKRTRHKSDTSSSNDSTDMDEDNKGTNTHESTAAGSRRRQRRKAVLLSSEDGMFYAYYYI